MVGPTRRSYAARVHHSGQDHQEDKTSEEGTTVNHVGVRRDREVHHKAEDRGAEDRGTGTRMGGLLVSTRVGTNDGWARGL